MDYQKFGLGTRVRVIAVSSSCYAEKFLGKEGTLIAEDNDKFGHVRIDFGTFVDGFCRSGGWKIEAVVRDPNASMLEADLHGVQAADRKRMQDFDPNRYLTNPEPRGAKPREHTVQERWEGFPCSIAKRNLLVIADPDDRRFVWGARGE